MSRAAALPEVAWEAPWLAPYRGVAAPVRQALRDGATVAEALDAQGGAMRFVDAAELPRGVAYEVHIRRSGCIPTRHHLHDLFNGLVWLRHPRLKQRLNELHAAEIEACGVTSVRGPLRDALTLFDENAALWPAPPELAEALRARDWQRLFVVGRALWAQSPPVLFGHALMEKLVAPRKAITAHVWLLPPGAPLDGGFANALTPGLLLARPRLALPVLGVPGWWPANAGAGFYDDPAVFRPLHR